MGTIFAEEKISRLADGKGVLIRGTADWDRWLESLRRHTGNPTLVSLYAAAAQSLARESGFEPGPPRLRRG